MKQLEPDNTLWKAASGYSSQKHGKWSKWDWWLHRRRNGNTEMGETSNGRVRLFTSFAAAQKAADKLNAAEVPA